MWASLHNNQIHTVSLRAGPGSEAWKPGLEGPVGAGLSSTLLFRNCLRTHPEAHDFSHVRDFRVTHTVHQCGFGGLHGLASGRTCLCWMAFWISRCLVDGLTDGAAMSRLLVRYGIPATWFNGRTVTPCLWWRSLDVQGQELRFPNSVTQQVALWALTAASGKGGNKAIHGGSQVIAYKMPFLIKWNLMEYLPQAIPQTPSLGCLPPANCENK